MAEEAEPVKHPAPEAAAEPEEESTFVTEPPVEEPHPEQKQEEVAREPAVAPVEEKEESRAVHQSRTAVGERMRKVVRARKQERLEKIMVYVEEKRVIRNRNVKILLQVSDASASRYLKELVRKGELNQLGRGRGARYELP